MQTQDVLDQISLAKQKQHDKKVHKMISFRRPLKNQACWEKKPVNALDRLALSERVMKDNTPLKMDAVLPPSSLMIPKKVRPPNPRDDSIFARVYTDEDCLKVPLRPIKGLKIDRRCSQAMPKEETHFLAQTHPPPSKKLYHKKRRSPRKLKFKRRTVAASFHPRRNTTFMPIKNASKKHIANNTEKNVITDLHLSTHAGISEFPKQEIEDGNSGKDEGIAKKSILQIVRDNSLPNSDSLLLMNTKGEVSNIFSSGNAIYPSNEKFDLEKYTRLYLDSKVKKKVESLPWKAFNKYSNTYRKVISHKVEISKNMFGGNKAKNM